MIIRRNHALDTDKYEGHTPAPWSFQGPQGLELANKTHSVVFLYDDPRMRIGGKADMQLIADAPLLLEEVKDLQITVDVQSVIVHDYNEQQSELKQLRAEVERLREQQKKILEMAELNMALEWGDTDASIEWGAVADIIKGWIE